MNLYSVSYGIDNWLAKSDTGDYTMTTNKENRHVFYTRKLAYNAIDDYLTGHTGQVMLVIYGDVMKSWFTVNTEKFTCKVGKHIQI